MSSFVSDEVLAQVLFASINDGSYPDDEEVVAAELRPSALDRLAELLEQARTEVKTSIRELSRLSAPDIDGWVSEARQLRNDIEDSKKLAEEIATEAQHQAELQTQVDDAAAKVELLQGEVLFNEALTDILQQIHDIRDTLDTGHAALVADNLKDAVASVQEAESRLESLRGCQNTRVFELVRIQIADYREVVGARLAELWDSLISVDVKASTVTIKEEISAQQPMSCKAVSEALDDLELLKNKIVAFRNAFDSAILTPRLTARHDDTVGRISFAAREISISDYVLPSSTASLFSDVSQLIQFLDTRLPSSVAKPLSEILVPNLVSRLVSGPLTSSVPTNLSDLSTFEETLHEARNFAETLDAHDWHGSEELIRWVKNAPRMWLTRRSESDLNTIRRLLLRGLGQPREVERVETQVLSMEDTMFTERGNDDWNAEWSDDEEEKKQVLPLSKTTGKINGKHKEDEIEDDVSAWDLDDDVAPPTTKSQNNATKSTEDEDGDAWGWGDENENQDSPTSPTSAPVAQTQKTTKSNGSAERNAPSGREVTLREMYSITALPEQILEILIQIISDADSLIQAEVDNPISPAARGLFSLPGVLLSMYRACAPDFYTRNDSGNMFLYNDSLYLAEQIRKFAEHHSSQSGSPPNGKLNIDRDVSALELFGKRAYGKEMESQRTILGDLLDGAQGFANCTEHPFAQQCELAISSTVDRLRSVHQQWKGVLSYSALLQSIGSLVSTVVKKIIIDIEDMSDISEPESERLTAFFNQIATLDDLFLPDKPSNDGPDAEKPVPLTAVYTPSWLKFQYLSNILESSLADIKYLWAESELALEFSAEELADLIEALFADSEYRRKAIGEIKRSGKGRP